MDEAKRPIISTAQTISMLTESEDAGHRGITRGTRTQVSRPGGNKSSRRTPSPPEEQTWQSPVLAGGFEQRIGSSVVEEFVAGHGAGDVLRELVQNEFDAGGTRVSVTF